MITKKEFVEMLNQYPDDMQICGNIYLGEEVLICDEICIEMIDRDKNSFNLHQTSKFNQKFLRIW